MKAECTWGDGPDVLLSLDGTHLLCQAKIEPNGFIHGDITIGNLGLTAAEAITLAHQLIIEAQKANNLNQAYTDYCNKCSEGNSDE